MRVHKAAATRTSGGCCTQQAKETMMRHPFDLELSELEAVHANLQGLTEAELATIAGGRLHHKSTRRRRGLHHPGARGSRRQHLTGHPKRGREGPAWSQAWQSLVGGYQVCPRQCHATTHPMSVAEGRDARHSLLTHGRGEDAEGRRPQPGHRRGDGGRPARGGCALC